MKDIYFVRHGETEENATHTHQAYDTDLSEKGIQQAEHVARYLKKLNPKALLTSPFPRARQTAEVIGEELDVPMTIVVAVHEILRPTFLYGKSHYSFATFVYLMQLFLHRSEDGWDNDSAENMFDLRNRVLDTKDLIIEEPEDSMIIVSHSIFIDMFIHLVCQEKPMSFFKFLHLMFFVKKIPNTAVIHIQYDEDAPKGVCPCQMVSITTPKDFA